MLKPEAVQISANCGLEKGIWFQVVEGMKGVAVRDESGAHRVYMLTQPTSHKAEFDTIAARMRQAWKEWSGDEDLYEMAFGGWKE